MLTNKQVKEIKEHLEKAQNPVFFFDNDQDGLCSYLLLQKYIGRGRGVAVRSFPNLDMNYFRKIEELNADYIFILDKPLVAGDFFKEVEKINLPVVWIDHHEIQIEDIPEFVNYYNPLYNKAKSNEPVTALCYQITQRKEDLWLGVVGCISDKYYPDFYLDFKKSFPELCIDSKGAFDIYYNSEIGKASQIMGFALKDSVTNVVNMQKLLMKSKSPYDILEESSKNKSIHEKFEFLNKKYKKFLRKAMGLMDSGKILFFEYGGDASMNSALANELSHKYPDKIIIVAYIRGLKASISARGKNVREIILKSIEGLEGARGGGHECSVGAQIKVDDLSLFRKNLDKNIK